MKKIIYLIFIIVIGMSCADGNEEIRKLLISAESLIDTNPDSAFILLEEVRRPEKLKEPYLSEYALLMIKAMDKSYRDIKGDTLIFNALDYFHEIRDIEKLGQANVYAGRVMQEREEYDPAMKYYLDAEASFKEINDEEQRGMAFYFMGELFYEKALFTEALDKFKESIACFSKNPDKYKMMIIIYRLMGNIYLVENQADSAFYYYNEGLALADSHNDQEQLSYMLQNQGMAFVETGNFDKAKENFMKSLTLCENKEEMPRIYFNLGYLYYMEQMNIDSARYFIDKCTNLLENIENPNLLSNIYFLLASVEKQNENHQSALGHYEKYMDNLSQIMTEKQNQNLLDIERKYKFELMENINNQLLQEKQQILLVCAALALAIIIGVFFFYQERMKNKYAQIEVEKKIRQLTDLRSSLSSRETIYQDLFVHQFDILKNTALMEEYIEKEDKEKGKHLLKKFHEIVYGEKGFDWDKLYLAMNAANGGDLERIKRKFPDMDTEDFKVCCLTYAGFSNSEMSFLLDVSVSTVQARKTEVREKIGVGKSINFKQYLASLIKGPDNME